MLTVQLDTPPLREGLMELIATGVATLRQGYPGCVATAKSDGIGLEQDIALDIGQQVEQIYVERLQQLLPDVPIIAEERGLVPGTLQDAFIVVDPDDGSKQLRRGNLDGVGTMFALVVDGLVVAAMVGHLGSWDCYGFVGGEKVRRWNPSTRTLTLLTARQGHSPRDSYVLIDQHPDELAPFARKLTLPRKRGGIYYHTYLDHGGISSLMCKLWSGKVGAFLLSARKADQPWDIIPVAGICQRLGYTVLVVDEERKRLTMGSIPIRSTPTERTHSYLICSPEHLAALPW